MFTPECSNLSLSDVEILDKIDDCYKEIQVSYRYKNSTELGFLDENRIR